MSVELSPPTEWEGARNADAPTAVGRGVLLRERDSNARPSGYVPDELPLLHPAKRMLARIGDRCERAPIGSIGSIGVDRVDRVGGQRAPKKSAIHFSARDGPATGTATIAGFGSCFTPMSASPGRT